MFNVHIHLFNSTGFPLGTVHIKVSLSLTDFLHFRSVCGKKSAAAELICWLCV